MFLIKHGKDKEQMSHISEVKSQDRIHGDTIIAFRLSLFRRTKMINFSLRIRTLTHTQN
jgi:hypothetical protein